MRRSADKRLDSSDPSGLIHAVGGWRLPPVGRSKLSSASKFALVQRKGMGNVSCFSPTPFSSHEVRHPSHLPAYQFCLPPRSASITLFGSPLNLSCSTNTAVSFPVDIKRLALLTDFCCAVARAPAHLTPLRPRPPLSFATSIGSAVFLPVVASHNSKTTVEYHRLYLPIKLSELIYRFNGRRDSVFHLNVCSRNYGHYRRMHPLMSINTTHCRR